MYVCMYVFMYVCMRACVCVRMYVDMFGVMCDITRMYVGMDYLVLLLGAVGVRMFEVCTYACMYICVCR